MNIEVLFSRSSVSCDILRVTDPRHFTEWGAELPTPEGAEGEPPYLVEKEKSRGWRDYNIPCPLSISTAWEVGNMLRRAAWAAMDHELLEGGVLRTARIQVLSFRILQGEPDQDGVFKGNIDESSIQFDDTCTVVVDSDDRTRAYRFPWK